MQIVMGETSGFGILLVSVMTVVLGVVVLYRIRQGAAADAKRASAEVLFAGLGPALLRAGEVDHVNRNAETAVTQPE
jgi:hypothetical protein